MPRHLKRCENTVVITVMTMNKSYSELIAIDSFEERVKYLRTENVVGEDVFGYYRYLNQQFYKSREWLKEIRPSVIVRDSGCDLAYLDRVIPDGIPIYIHHINPITVEDLINHSDLLRDPENLITTTFITHNAIHYGGEILEDYKERSPFDTCPWR